MTSLEKGVPSLKVETVVCRKGEKLTGEKARLLLLLGYMHAVSLSLSSRVAHAHNLDCPRTDNM